MTIHRASGETETFDAAAAVETTLEVAILQTGGVLPLILNRALASSDERSLPDRRHGAKRPAR